MYVSPASPMMGFDVCEQTLSLMFFVAARWKRPEKSIESLSSTLRTDLSIYYSPIGAFVW